MHRRELLQRAYARERSPIGRYRYVVPILSFEQSAASSCVRAHIQRDARRLSIDRDREWMRRRALRWMLVCESCKPGDIVTRRDVELKANQDGGLKGPRYSAMRAVHFDPGKSRGRLTRVRFNGPVRVNLLSRLCRYQKCPVEAISRPGDQRRHAQRIFTAPSTFVDFRAQT